MNENPDNKTGSGNTKPLPRPGTPTHKVGSDQGQEIRECLGDQRGGPGEGQLESGPGEERRFYVYFLRRPDQPDPLETGDGCPFYVGKGTNCRYKDHRKEANQLLHKPGRKSYKVNVIHFLWSQRLNFIEEIFCSNLSEQEALELEIEAIQAYGRIRNGGILTNMTDGGEGTSGRICSYETKEKIGSGNRGKKRTKRQIEQNRAWHKGKSLSPETREKIRNFFKGKPLSDEHKEKVRQKAIGRIHSNETKLKISKKKKGKPLSNEHRKNISKGGKGRIVSEETKDKIRQRALGRKHNLETIEKIRKKKTGVIQSQETRKKRSDSLKGKKKTKEHVDKIKETWRKKKMKQNTADNLLKLKQHIDQSKSDSARIEGQILQLENQRAQEFGCPTDVEAEEYIRELEGDVETLERELNEGVKVIQEELGWSNA